MAAPQIAPLPPFFDMSDGMVIKVTAVDAATNATVSGVVISGVSIDVDPIEAGTTDNTVPIVDAAFTYAGAA